MKISNEIICDFNKGDAKAFNSIFDEYRMRIFYFVHKIINDKETAEEITSDTFVKLHNLHGNFLTEHHIRAFLHIAAKNASLDFLRHRKARGVHVPLVNEDDEFLDIPVTNDSYVEADVLRYIYAQAQKLPPRMQLIFKLSYFDELSLEEIAEKLNISKQTVANQRVVALDKLRMKTVTRKMILFAFLYLTKD